MEIKIRKGDIKNLKNNPGTAKKAEKIEKKLSIQQYKAKGDMRSKYSKNRTTNLSKKQMKEQI